MSPPLRGRPGRGPLRPSCARRPSSSRSLNRRLFRVTSSICVAGHQAWTLGEALLGFCCALPQILPGTVRVFAQGLLHVLCHHAFHGLCACLALLSPGGVSTLAPFLCCRGRYSICSLFNVPSVPSPDRLAPIGRGAPSNCPSLFLPRTRLFGRCEKKEGES